MFEDLAAGSSDCRSWEWEVVAADVRQDLTHVLVIERTTASVRGYPPTSSVLRSTTISRREDGDWKIVHRHADPVDDSADLLSRLRRDR